jgi:hypothetical protein
VSNLKLSIGIRALLLQLASLVLTYSLLLLLKISFGISFGFLVGLLIHCCFAACAALILRFDWWWGLIQFLFPLLVYWSYWQNIPSYFYLIGLFVLSLLFWSTYRTQVPYYPSKSALISPVSTLLPSDAPFNFIDLGSGMGGLVLDLSARSKNGQFFGVEIAPLPWLVSVLRSFFREPPVKFYFGSYTGMDLSHFRVVFCYLSPAAMSDLWLKVKAEMQPGSLFLSYEFIVPDVPPDLCLELESDGSLLYGWRI